MVTLLGDVHFWTLRDDIIVKDADIGAFRYQDKNTVCKERVYYEDKRQYLEARGIMVTPKNSRPSKLRESLREFEELLSKERVIWEGWHTHVYQLIFASGIISTLTVNPNTGDLTRITFDKFLVGKLLSEHLADVVITRHHMIFSYNECRLTVVHLTRPPPEGHILERLTATDPKIYTCEVAGPSGRRFERKLSANLSGDMLVVWWQTSEDEVYPWSPLAKDRDRANILVYSLHSTSLDLVCYCRTEMAPLSVSFSKVQPNVLLTVEQGFGKKGGVTVLSCVYEVERGALHRITVTTIPLEAPLMAHSHNPAEDRLLLACNNGVLALHCDSRGMTHVTKAGLIPCNIAWLDSGNIVVVSNERGQVQCFDLALSLIRMQLIMEDSNPQRILDFSEHFCHQQSLLRLTWAPTKIEEETSQHNIPHLLLLHYIRGPLACLRVDVSAMYKGGLTAVALVAQYIKHRQLDEAVNLLVSLNWDQEGPVAIRCLTAIANHLLRLPLTHQRETQIEGALGSFHVPVQPLSQAVEEEFGPAVRALTRRFFFRVLRCGKLEKAFRLALDLKDHDCFMAVHSVAKQRGESQIAATALQNARDLESSCSAGSCSSVLYGESDASTASESCSESCSTCFSDSDSVSGSDYSDHEIRECGGDGRLEVVTESKNLNVPDHSSELSTRMQYLSLGSSISRGNSIGSSANLIADSAASGISHATAITSQDGTVTINIRQPDHQVKRYSHQQELPPARSAPQASLQAGRAKEGRAPQTVREVFYSSDPNEEFVDSERVSVFVDKEDLQKQYDRAIFHGFGSHFLEPRSVNRGRRWGHSQSGPLWGGVSKK
ncbi:WD repeat-containing and planar cell polarity effector protein fritz homolog isoform X2 [Penaeus japonicus]|uniref:WD repeat-containing and planar cell polarity effector protein fritz homolog isoform X2 n=1 Tax=Penaeus japonicus TaxID=27405 RepID=UPI001C70B773|nr:WD repeat-containing and planar cell polarity effector protein fritz homolog isoform X2 [Penaeus japonicus]